MKQVLVLIYFIGFCLGLPPCARSQSTSPDSAFLQQSLANISRLYKTETAENLRLYNGSEYLRQGHGVKGFPFFQSPDMLKGDVFYDGTLYQEVPMQYDLEEDNLVISDYSGNVFIRLVKEKIQYFIIDGHRFVHLRSGAGLPADGFYESLYNGRLAVYARRQKKTIQSLNPSDEGYRLYSNWLVEKQGMFFPVESQGAMLDILADKKDLLKKYIRSDKLTFRKAPEVFLTRLTAYYDQLNH